MSKPTWIATQFRAFIALIGLAGDDGNLSYSKVIILIVCVFCAKWHLNEIVGVTAIAASYGAKMLDHELDKLSMQLSSSTTHITEDKTEVSEIIARRDPDLGIEVTHCK